MMGNGAQTKAALRRITEKDPVTEKHKHDGTASPTDPDRYELARIQKAEEEARKLRRQNAEAEGHYILASEVSLQTQRLLAQEVTGFESVLRSGARKVADAQGVDFKAVRKVLFDVWRAHRSGQSEALAKTAEDAEMTTAEQAEDI